MVDGVPGLPGVGVLKHVGCQEDRCWEGQDFATGHLQWMAEKTASVTTRKQLEHVSRLAQVRSSGFFVEWCSESYERCTLFNVIINKTH